VCGLDRARRRGNRGRPHLWIGRESRNNLSLRYPLQA
jgi:hypothetical protein